MQRKKQKGRAYGGILVYYEKELKYILAFLEKSSENFYGLKSHKSQRLYTCRQGFLPSSSI